jgi:hypothetical protein
MSALDKQIDGTHYKDMPIQPIEFITKNKLDWYQGNIIKYASRHHNKGGADDLRKVIHYAELALEAQYGQPVADALETQYGGLSGSACGVVGTKPLVNITGSACGVVGTKPLWYPEKQ